MEDLLKYFMKRTDERFDKIDKSLDDLKGFKVESIVTARWVSLIVSAVCGLITMLVTIYASGKMR